MTNSEISVVGAPRGPVGTSAETKRRRSLLALGLVAVIAAVAFGIYWFVDARYYEETDDAYVIGDLVQVTSEVPGTVIFLSADNTQGVQRDQTLLELDPADAQVAMSAAEANLGESVRRVRALFATADQLRAQITDREIAFKRAQDDYKRRANLVEDGAISSEELSHDRDSVVQLQASLLESRQELYATVAQIDGTTVQSHPFVLAAEAAVRDASLALRRTHISAPVAGVVAQRSVQVGQRIAAGTPLMAVVPLEDVWIDANFKEVQLGDIRVGQPVTLTADVYGGSVTYHGKVVGLSAGSGTAFDLLPAQNASGNWIKIVQRLPVRIVLEAQELEAHPLRIGLSVSVDVNVRDTSGPTVASQVRGKPIPAQPSLDNDPGVDARIAQIVALNDAPETSSAAK